MAIMKNGSLCYCMNYQAGYGIQKRSCPSYVGGEWQYDKSKKKYYRVIQEACNGYSLNGSSYEGQEFKLPSYFPFNQGKLIEADCFNDLLKLINRELERRADYCLAANKQITGSTADDRNEWHDPDFDYAHLTVREVQSGDYVRASRANSLIDQWNLCLTSPVYRIVKRNLTVPDSYLAESGDYARGTTLSKVYATLLAAQKECACFNDCDGYAVWCDHNVCTCYGNCNDY